MRSRIPGVLKWAFLGVVVSVAGFVWLLTSIPRSPPGAQAGALNSGKQVLMSLKMYAYHNGLSYPDGRKRDIKSVNQVFRELFKEGVVDDERIFSVPTSLFRADNQTRAPPDFAEAVAAGECHWMLLKQQTDAAHPKTPHLIENALNISWPPRWSVGLNDGVRSRGQAWPERTILIIRNDGSAAFEKLRPDGTLDWHSPSNLDEHGKSWIDYLTPEQVAKLEYWDIEEK